MAVGIVTLVIVGLWMRHDLANALSACVVQGAVAADNALLAPGCEGFPAVSIYAVPFCWGMFTQLAKTHSAFSHVGDFRLPHDVQGRLL